MKTQRMIFENTGPTAWERDETEFEKQTLSALLIYGIRLRGVEVFGGSFMRIHDYCKGVAAKYGRPYANLANFIVELKQGFYETLI